jgi:hypothetical protein
MEKKEIDYQKIFLYFWSNMKNNKITFKFFLMVALFSTATISLAQNTIVIQPDATNGQDAYVFEKTTTTNFATSDELFSFAWTFSGTPYLSKSFIKFDLSQVPINATITDAKLSFYHNATSSSAGQAGTNSCELKKVTSTWSESSVSWNNQPSTTSAGSVIIPTSTSATQDYTDINITKFAKGWHLDPNNNFGFEMDIVNKTPLSSMKFCSSNYATASKRPKLTITYTNSDQKCVTIKPDALAGKDAFVFEKDPNVNAGNSVDFLSFAWSFSGTPYVGQSLIGFNLSQVPTNVTVTDARLSLYHNPTSSSSGQSGSNEAELKEIMTSWDEATVTWNNKPTTSSAGSITLATSTSGIQDYENIDLTNMVQGWYKNAASNNGLMLDIITRDPLASMLFCSSDHSDSTKRPKLLVCYTNNETNSIPSINESIDIKLFPIPARNFINIYSGQKDIKTIKIYDSLGRWVRDIQISNGLNSIDVSDLTNGIYQYSILGKTSTRSGKFIIAK